MGSSAAGAAHELGEHTADGCGVQNQVDRAGGQVQDALDHPVAVAGDFSPQGAQLVGVGGAGGGQDPRTAGQGNLHRGVADGGASAVHEHELLFVAAVIGSAHPQQVQAAVRRLGRHRQGGGLLSVEAVGYRGPVLKDGQVGGAGAG